MLALALALAAADPHQVAQDATVAMMRCFYGQAYYLDDHISPASVIAQGVLSACGSQITEWKYDSFEDVKPLGAANEFYQGLDKALPQTATEVVLRVRAARKPQN